MKIDRSISLAANVEAELVIVDDPEEEAESLVSTVAPGGSLTIDLVTDELPMDRAVGKPVKKEEINIRTKM